MALNFVTNPYAYYNARNQGKPVANGSIFVGEPDTDPTIAINQKTVTAKQENGTEVPIAQPISTNSGGYPVDSGGNPVVLLVDGNYSIRINDKLGALALEQANVNNGTPLTAVNGIERVDNVVDLRSVEPSSDGQSIFLVVHTTQGIGSGHFYFDSSDAASADNDGTIIVTTGGARWKRPLGDMFLAEWFGVDKSLTDNFAAINSAYDAAETAGYDGLWLPTNGGELTITDTIPLKRGVALMGGSTFDDQSGTVIKRGNNMDVPVIATPKWFTPLDDVAASYFVIEGITINGNKANQTVSQPAIAFWGVFVGSLIDNVFVLENFGAALSNEHAFDFNIGLFYGNRCTVGSGGVWEIEQLDVAGGPIGLIEAESVYLENPEVTIGGGVPQVTPANRGEGLRVGNIGRLHIANLHQEACDVNIHVTHGTNEIIKVGARSSAHSGDPARLHSDVFLTAGITNLDLAPTKAFNPDASFNWIDMTASILASNLYPTVARTQVRWGGCNLSSPASDEFVTTGVRHMADLEHRKINNASKIQTRNYISETNDDLFHFDQYEGGVVTRGSKVNQASEIAFETMSALGGSSNRFADLVPRKVVVQDTINTDDALFVTSTDLLRVRLNGITYNINITAV